MNHFYGFDLGDAESAIARLDKEGQQVPEIIPVRDSKSWITAYARLAGGELLIGEGACYAADAVTRKLRFKSRFLTDPETDKDIRSFAAGVLGELVGSGEYVPQTEDSCFYIGCPAGWNRNDRERYREIFERVGYPPVKIISESRAALISAVHSRHLQLSYDILNQPVLVVDIGSSTTDFAYITGGKEVELQTAGEVMLGGGIMDEILLEESVLASRQRDRIERVFAESEAWRSYCEFAARRLKEQYFSDQAYWDENDCTKSISILYHGRARLTLRMDRQMADRLLKGATDRLGGKSFQQVFTESLRNVRSHINGDMPELLFMTGGVSRIPQIQEWCREIFPEAVVVTGTEPEFSVCRGLAYSGRTDEELREFKEEIAELRASSVVEDIVLDHINDLYRKAVDSLVEPILTHAVLPVFDRWRRGEIRRLADIDVEMQKEIDNWLRSEEAGELLVKPVTAWLKPVSEEIEKHTLPICVRHHVPYKAMSLTSYIAYSEINIELEAKNVFAMEEIMWLINTIISVLVGLLCGGSGVALITSGLPGIVSGAAISLLVLLLGKKPIENAVLNADIPRPLRKIVPKRYFESRMKSLTDDVKENFFETLETEKSEEITDRMVSDISEQIDTFLTKMAEVVEIPLG